MPTPSLSDCQDAFARGVFADDNKVPDWIDAPAGRFDIYRSSVLANLRNALRAVFPVVLRLTGDRFFEHAADQFAREHPSHSGDLHRYGGAFADFLAAFPAAQALDYLPDVARLEWFWHEAFHAAGAPALDLDALAQVAFADYEHLRFQFQPACRLLSAPYPVLRIWEANQPVHPVVEEINLRDGAENIIVFRRGHEVMMDRLSAGEQAFARRLHAGAVLGAAAAHAAVVDPGVDAAAALRWLASREIIAGFEVILSIERGD